MTQPTQPKAHPETPAPKTGADKAKHEVPDGMEDATPKGQPTDDRHKTETSGPKDGGGS